MSIIRFIFPMALQSFRSNPFHTFLSILGIIIGVGALFSILSLADGMEKMGREQITSTSNLQSLAIQSKQYTTIDNLRVKLDDFEIMSIAQTRDLENKLNDSRIQMTQAENILLPSLIDANSIGLQKVGILNIHGDTFSADTLLAGRLLNHQDIKEERSNILINTDFAQKYFVHNSYQDQVGSKLKINDSTFTIAGVITKKDSTHQGAPQIIMPITIIPESAFKKNPPTVRIDIATIESYDSENEIIKKYLNDHFKGGAKAFSIISYADRMTQLIQGMAVFRIVMGLIVGISVLVGGIGIMNVLLMSIKERTKEIGIRKAIGASQHMIRWQFLLEALLISIAGCFLGVLLGVLFMSIAVPLMQHFTDMPFGWVFSLQTTMIIVFVALLIGLLFGFYPAAKAAKLDAIDAIRHE